jgi:hypothetical protein
MKKSISLCLLFVARAALAQTLWTPGGTVGNNTTTSNVGIGTATPQAKLEVIGGSSTFGLIVEGDGSVANARIALRRANDTAATGNLDWIGNTNAVGARIGVNDSVAGAMEFKLGGSGSGDTKAIITSAGNVGIGTASPTQKLTVAGNINKSGSWIIGDFAWGTNTLEVHSNGWDGASNGSYGGIAAGHGYFYGGLQSGGSSGSEAASGELYVSGRSTLMGNVGIGTTNPTQKLSVNGTIRAKEVIVDSGWSDYVFADDYRLAPLSEIETHIKAERHLPGIPSASEVTEHGISVGEMQAKLLAKIEELTLHAIAQEKRTALLENQNEALRHELTSLKQSNSIP